MGYRNMPACGLIIGHTRSKTDPSIYSPRSEAHKLLVLGARDIIQASPHNTDDFSLLDESEKSNLVRSHHVDLRGKLLKGALPLPLLHTPVSVLVRIIIPSPLQSARVEYACYALLPVFGGNKD